MLSMFGGSIFAWLALSLAAAAMLGFPAYQWTRERRRQGESVWSPGLIGVLLLGAVGVASMLAFLMAKQ